MNEIKDFITIFTFLGAIIIGLTIFLVNVSYDIISAEYKLGIKELSKKEVTTNVIIFFLTQIIFISFYIIMTASRENGVDDIKGSILSESNCYFMIAYTLMIGIYLNIKVIIRQLIEDRYVRLIRLCKNVVMFMLILLLYLIPRGTYEIYKNEISKEQNGFYLKNINLYVDDKLIDSMEIPKGKKVNIGVNDKIGLKINGQSLVETNLIETKLSNSEQFKLNLDGKDILFKADPRNKMKNGDSIELYVNGILTASDKINYTSSSNKLNGLVSAILYFIIMYSILVMLYGFFSIINRIDSIKNKEIILDSGKSIIGKILFIKDDLYVIFYRNESIYVSKSKVKDIVDIKLLPAHKDKIVEKKILKINQIHFISELAYWSVLVNFKSNLYNFVKLIFSHTVVPGRKLYDKIKNRYLKMLLITKFIIVIVIVIILILFNIT